MERVVTLRIAVAGPIRQCACHALTAFERIIDRFQSLASVHSETIAVISQGAPGFDQSVNFVCERKGIGHQQIDPARYGEPPNRDSYRSAALQVSARASVLIVATNLGRAGQNWTPQDSHGSDLAILIALRHGVPVIWLDTSPGVGADARWVDLDPEAFQALMSNDQAKALDNVRALSRTIRDEDMSSLVAELSEAAHKKQRVESLQLEWHHSNWRWLSAVWDKTFNATFAAKNTEIEAEIRAFLDSQGGGPKGLELLLPAPSELATGFDLIIRNSTSAKKSEETKKVASEQSEAHRLVEEFEKIRKGDPRTGLSQMATFYQGLHRFSFVAVAVSVSSAAILGSLSAAECRIAAVSLTLFAASVFAYARWHGWQELAADLRVVSELLRHAPAAICSGQDPYEVEDNMLHYGEQDPRKRWIIMKFREDCAKIYHNPTSTSAQIANLSASDLMIALRPWFDAQIKWLRMTELSYRFAATFGDAISRSSFFLGVLASAAGVLLPVSSSNAEVLGQIFLCCAAVSLTVFSVASQAEIVRLASRYRTLADVLERHRDQLTRQAALPGAVSADIQPMLRTACKAAIAEAIEWRLLQRYHPIHSPG